MPNPVTDPDEIICLDTYFAEMDPSGIKPETMTDIGVPVRDLLPVTGACLTPGHPSPVGRTVAGDLAYVEHAHETSLTLPRAHVGLLAHLLHRHIEDQCAVDPEVLEDLSTLLRDLLNAAVPEVLFDESAHGEIACQMVRDKTLLGNFGDLHDLTEFYD